MRRVVLIAGGITVGAAIAALVLAACSSSGGASGADAGGLCAVGDAGFGPDGGVLTPCAWNQPVTQPSDTTATTARAACQYKRGAMPEATLGPTDLPASIPIDNIVVVMMENHSFDNYLGHLNQYGNRNDIEVADAGATNPAADGGPVPWIHAAHECTADTNHEWLGTHQEIDNDKMDGFVTTNDGWNEPEAGVTDPSLYDGARAMWWYDQTDLPLYYQLANTFAVADHYHCSLPGPTYPNRMYLIAGTSFGQTGSTAFPDVSGYPFPQNDATVLDELEKRHVSWQLYTDGLPTAAIIYTASILHRWGRSVISPISQFVAAAKAGTLPAVSFVDPNFETEGTGAGTDEHPPGDIQNGQQFVGQIVQAVTTSPQWAHTALFITHDENGGFYDHVPPPAACEPDALQPVDNNENPTTGAFDIYGLRVLLIAVSPYAKKGYVGHHVYDHTSILRFIQAKFQLPALTSRDANAEPPTDLFDFTDPPAFATPPAITVPAIDPTALSYCETTFGK
jgi:phospholipase C